MLKKAMNPTKPARRPRSSAHGGAKTIDEYLARVEPDQRDALEALRQVIRKAAPKAEEVITYGIPPSGRTVFSSALRHQLGTAPASDEQPHGRRLRNGALGLQQEHGHDSLHTQQAVAGGARQENRQGESGQNDADMKERVAMKSRSRK